MNKHFIFSIAILLLYFNLQAQNRQNISGIVVESDSREPLQYANVILFNDLDSAMVNGVVTDVDGNFVFDNIGSGKYYLTVSFIGFEKQQTPSFTHKNSTHVGKVPIMKSAILLDEVSVTGERGLLNTKLDKKVYNVGKDISSVSGSVSDILQNVPSVSVNINGNISLRGSSNITFFINGRPSSQLRRNAPTRLQQIPANTIEKIEVITNPSAKYDPEGAGGIINIVQRDLSETGLNGQIIENIGNERRFNTSVVLNYGTKKINAFATYSFRHAKGTNKYTDDRTNRNVTDVEHYNESGSTISNPLANIIDAGMTYQFDEENLLEISGAYFHQNSFHEGFTNISEENNQNQTSLLSSQNTNDEIEREGEGAVAFEHIFNGNEDHSLVFEGEFAAYYEREDLRFNENFILPSGFSSFQKIFVEKRGNQTNLISEYAQPLDGDTEFEAGYSGEIINDDIYYINNHIPSKFLFNQNIHALYGILARDIENFNIEVGLRGEQAIINTDLVEPNVLSSKNDYFKLYPSARLTYEIDETQNIALSYSKRINRPDADQLNPYPEYTDPRNGEAGNSNLQPEQIHSFDLTYQLFIDKISIIPSLFYRYKTDAFTSIVNLISDSIAIRTIENLSNQKSGGAELLVSGKFAKWVNLNLSTSLFYDEIDATDIGYSNNKNTISGTVKLYSLFNISNSTILQLNFNYDSPVLTPQGQKEEIFYINAGLKQTFLNNQLALTLTVSDLLNTYEERWTVNTPGLNQVTNLYRKEPIFFLGISWRFGESYRTEENKFEYEEEGLRKL